MYAPNGAAIARMFIARMPSSAKPRSTSSVSIRALAGTGAGRIMARRVYTPEGPLHVSAGERGTRGIVSGAKVTSSETPIVGSRPIHRRHFRPEQPQIDCHLPTVMRRVQERIPNHLVTRLLEREMTAREEAPGGPEVFIGGRLQGLARLRHGLVERRNQLRARVQGSWFVIRSVLRRDIQLVKGDSHTDP